MNRRTSERMQSIVLDEKQMVSMPMVISQYLPKVKSRGKRIPCPLHHGDGFNFAYSDRFYRCFRCNCTGDIISFVESFFDLSFADTIRKINGDFGLNLPIDKKPTLRESREAQHKREAYLRKIELERLEREQELFLFWSEWENLADLDISVRSELSKLPNFQSAGIEQFASIEFPTELALLLAEYEKEKSYWKEVKEV